MTLPNGPRKVVSVDFFGQLPVTAPQGNQHIILFTDRFSRRAAMHAVPVAELTAHGAATILFNHCTPLWDCPGNMFPDTGPNLWFELSRSVYRLICVQKVATSLYHTMGNGGTEHVNHTLAQMRACVVNERQDDWD